jgi:carboxypeptidase Taq
MELLEALGYDFEAGRQDLAEHPFTINFNSFDVRITTRIDEGNPSGMIWSSIHELGHALYEQGLPPSEYGLPLSEAASISIHESQSRLWENHVGRSLAFCEYILPVLRKYFPEQVKDVSALEFFKAINKVKTSLIRTEADELTYHFHVMIRYQIEKKLFDGSMKVRDIPTYWNELYKDYLALDVPDQKQGCLQDVHWSHGSFGYFPTYSLGSLYGAQFFAEASNSIQDLDAGIRMGQVGALLQWLRNEVYVHGRFYTSEELSKKICGKGLDTSHFMDYLLAKYKLIYEF